MTQQNSIRSICNATFNAKLPSRENNRLGNAAFRKGVIVALIESTGCTWNAACTHYNHSLQLARKATPELCVGLGRVVEVEEAAVEAAPTFASPEMLALLQGVHIPKE